MEENGIESDIAARMNFIRNNDLSQALLTNGFRTVITGDSLSYNQYDFDPVARTNATNAYDCFPGMLSWSFMVRDAIHRHDPYFKSWEELEIQHIGNFSSINGNNAPRYEAAYNGIFQSARTTNGTAEYVIPYKTSPYSNRIVLHMAQNSSYPCTFDVYVNDMLKEEAVNNASDGTYQGISPMYVALTGDFTPGDTVTIKLTNFVPTDSEAGIILHGVGSIERKVHLTGRGSWTSGDLLADINNRILQYSPDLLIVILGANDIAHGVGSDTYKSNMQQIITKTHRANASAEIVLITSPQMSEYSEATQKVYNRKLEELAQEYRCYYVNLVELFKNTPTSQWRFDNVHFTRYGNSVLAKTLLNLLVPVGLYDKDLTNSEMSFYSGRRYRRDNLPACGDWEA